MELARGATHLKFSGPKAAATGAVGYGAYNIAKKIQQKPGSRAQNKHPQFNQRMTQTPQTDDNYGT